jgi:hypothetical protein
MQNASKYYTLPTETMPGLNCSNHVADLLEIKDLLESRGFSIQNTRIARYIDYLKQLVGGGPRNESLIFKNSVDQRFRSSIDWYLYVLREVHELMWILRGLKVHIPAGLDSRLGLLISGSDFAALDLNTHSRNVQFELRIASYFCQAGWAVDLSTATDIIALHDEYALFVECKRVGNMSQLQRRLAEASKQLSRRMPRQYKKRIVFGSIVVDVTKVAFSHNGLTWALTPEHSKDINQGKFKWMADLLADAPEYFGSRDIIRYWFQIHIPCFIRNPPQSITRFSNYYIENFRARGKSLEVLKLLRQLDKVPNIRDEREVPAVKLTPRTGMHLPSGSRFRMVEQNILHELIKTDQVAGTAEMDVIAELEFEGVKHEFTLFDLREAVYSIPASEMETLMKDTVESGLKLVLVMYMRRYPYEKIDHPAF